MIEPPEDTRAYFRGRCLAQYAAEVVAASWDSVIFDVGRESLVRVPMMEPERGTKQARRCAVRPVPEREGPARGASPAAEPDTAPGCRRAPYAKRRRGEPVSSHRRGRFLAKRRGGGSQMATRDTGGQSQSGKVAPRRGGRRGAAAEANPEVAERAREDHRGRRRPARRDRLRARGERRGVRPRLRPKGRPVSRNVRLGCGAGGAGRGVVDASRGRRHGRSVDPRRR